MPEGGPIPPPDGIQPSCIQECALWGGVKPAPFFSALLALPYHELVAFLFMALLSFALFLGGYGLALGNDEYRQCHPDRDNHQEHTCNDRQKQNFHVSSLKTGLTASTVLSGCRSLVKQVWLIHAKDLPIVLLVFHTIRLAFPIAEKGASMLKTMVFFP